MMYVYCEELWRFAASFLLLTKKEKVGQTMGMGRFRVFTILFFLCSLAHLAQASVTGTCANCHTMHNSQDGASLSSQPQNYLLADDCVGCHSSSGTETIVALGSTRIPIVFNTTAYPTQPLAGGNFYKVSLGGASNDVYGHNVWGISGVDANLAEAPGSRTSCAGPSCHTSLATDPATTYGNGFYGENGCIGCHQSTRHHGASVSDGSLETAESGWYRFLSGHGFNGPSGPDPAYGVYGVEDADWEQNPVAGHNSYQGFDEYYVSQPGTGLDAVHSITAFCSGCHTDFHSAMTYFFGVPGHMESPWLRHPIDFALPTTGEYAGYDPVLNYDPAVPVAWLNPETPATGEAVVMCLSCHTAHGSEYPDMLRWDYDAIIAQGGASSTGCFRCHSLKDE